MLSLQAGIYRPFFVFESLLIRFLHCESTLQASEMLFFGQNSFPRPGKCIFVGKIPVSGLGKCNSEVKNPFPESGKCNSGLRNLSPKLWNAGAKCETIPQK